MLSSIKSNIDEDMKFDSRSRVTECWPNKTILSNKDCTSIEKLKPVGCCGGAFRSNLPIKNITSLTTGRNKLLFYLSVWASMKIIDIKHYHLDRSL